MVRAILLQMIAAGFLISLALYLTGHANLIVGFALGLFASVSNCIALGRQLSKAADLPIQRAVAQVQTGWFVRLTLAIILLSLSALFAQVNFLAALTGFFVFHIVLVLRAACAFACGWAKDRKERGE